MKKTQEGIVIEINSQIAKVKVARHGDCENCGSCPGSNAMVLEANNKIGARKGDKVTFELIETGMLKAAFIVYILPLLSIFLGVQIGQAFSKFINVNTYVYEVLGGVTAFLLSIAFIIYYERATKSNINKLPLIIKISN